MNDDQPVIYLIMRTDMDSMNPGKACAQANHAGVQAAVRISNLVKNTNIRNLWDEYITEAGGFGTTITLGANEKQMMDIYNVLHINLDEYHYYCGLVHDPSYPIRDGSVTHLIPINTCLYIFGRRGDIKHFVSNLELMP